MLLALVASPLEAQVVFLQNDSFVSGAFNCQSGIGDSEGLAAKFTAAPGQYPYTIDRIRVLGCGGGQDAYFVTIYQDDADTVTPGPFLWQSQNAYFLDGSNVFNDILMSSEPEPPPPIASGSIRVEITCISIQQPIGFGNDTNGITSHRNFLRDAGGVWSFAESQGVAGDWILRLGIIPSGAPTATATATFTATAAATSTPTATPTTTPTAASTAMPTPTPTPTPSRTPTPTPTPTPMPTPTPTPNGTPPPTPTATRTPNPLARNYFTVTPCRVIDTRNPDGPYGGPALIANTERTFVLAGQCGISSMAKAVSLNVAVVNPTDGPGFLTLYPGGTTLPLFSTINYNLGKIRANNAIVPLGAAGDVTVHCGQGAGTAHAVIDLNGYFQ